MQKDNEKAEPVKAIHWFQWVLLLGFLRRKNGAAGDDLPERVKKTRVAFQFESF
jgi:hypothetical protein